MINWQAAGSFKDFRGRGEKSFLDGGPGGPGAGGEEQHQGGGAESGAPGEVAERPQDAVFNP